MITANAQAKPAYGPSKGMDWPLMLITAVLLAFGLSALYSVDSSRLGGAFFPKQLMFTAIGSIIMIVAGLVRPAFWMRLWPAIYGLNLASLIAILVMGKERFGAQRWIDIGPIELQPSEITKVAMAVCLAAFIASRKEEIEKFSTFAWSIVLTLPVMVLLMMQPHLGATICVFVIWMAICLAGGVPWKFPVASFGILALVLVGAFFSPKLPKDLEYMRGRITAKINPDTSSNAYQQHQSVLAIANGGMWGRGFNRGERKRDAFVPMQHNDFIFSVVGEEGGFVGCLVVLGCFGFFFSRGWWIAMLAKADASRLMAIGLVAFLGFHMVVNVGMNVGLTPVVGLWLPFMSYGGTALWMCMASVGLLLAVKRYDAE